MEPPELPRWLDAMFPAGMRRRMIDVGDDQAMHVAEWGAPDGRPVLMLHGNPTWGFLWRRVAGDLLRDDGGRALRLVVPDLIGLGCSSKPRDPSLHTLVNHARWLGAAIDALDLRDLVFAGQDWGGPIGLHALGPRIDRVRALVVLNTVPGPPREGFIATRFHKFSRMPVVSDIAFRLLGYPQNMVAAAQGDRSSIGFVGAVARAYRWPLRRVRDRVAPLALARMVPHTMQHPSIAALREVQDVITAFEGPIHIVWGDRDPVLGSVIRHLQRLLPQAKVTRTQAGHFLQEEVPLEIAAAIRAAAG